MSAATQLREAATEIAASTPDVEPPHVHVAWQRVMDQVQAVGKNRYDPDAVAIDREAAREREARQDEAARQDSPRLRAS